MNSKGLPPRLLLRLKPKDPYLPSAGAYSPQTICQKVGEEAEATTGLQEVGESVTDNDDDEALCVKPVNSVLKRIGKRINPSISFVKYTPKAHASRHLIGKDASKI